MKIFLSHSSDAKPILRRIRELLTPGVDGWVDERELNWGEDISDSLRKAVDTCDFFIPFLSKMAINSTWVQREITWALEKEREIGKTFLLPILMPDAEINEANKLIPNVKFYVKLANYEDNSIQQLANEIDRRIFRILISREDEYVKMFQVLPRTEYAKRSLGRHIACLNGLDKVRQRNKRSQLERALDIATNLSYTIVGPPQIYHHDREIINGMKSGDVYRATHPFSSNTKAHYLDAYQFKAYIDAQRQAIQRGVDIRRLYIIPGASETNLSAIHIAHFSRLGSLTGNCRVVYQSNIADNNFGQDFVIFDDDLVGVGVPKTGEMLGSEYQYSVGENRRLIADYTSHFDVLYETASPLDNIIGSYKLTQEHREPATLDHQTNASEPAFVTQTPVSINGEESQRLMVVLRTAGCSYDKYNKGCTMCDFKRHALGSEQISPHLLRQQLEYALDLAIFGNDAVGQLDLLTLGSFLHTREVPEEFANWAFEKLSTIGGLRKILIESRAPYISSSRLVSLKRRLRKDQIMEVGLGVESSNPRIRNDVLNKNLSETEILRSIDACHDAGVEFCAYLLVGSMGLSEDEALNDCVKSAEYIFSACREKNVNCRVALEPVFITSDTQLEKDYLNGSYKLVSLWTVVDVIIKVARMGTVFVGLSDENLSNNRVPTGCEVCTPKLREAIERFNSTQETTELRSLSCGCRT